MAPPNANRRAGDAAARQKVRNWLDGLPSNSRERARAQAALNRGACRAASHRAIPEQQVQRAVCKHLRLRGAPGLVWFAVPNGGRRSPVEAAIFAGLGVRAGVLDLILLHRGRAFALELKTDAGRPTAAQTQFL